MKNKEIAEWWESKRKIYNIILIGYLILSHMYDYTYYSEYQSNFEYSIVDELPFVGFWILGANIFYCLGLGFELTCKYYNSPFTSSARLGLLIFGIIVSVIWTTIGIA